MLLHQFREHFVLDLQLGFKLLDAFLFRLVLSGMLCFESGGSVLEKLLLPTIEYCLNLLIYQYSSTRY